MSRCTAGSDIAVTAARAEQLSPRAQLSQRGCPSLAVPQVASPRAPSLVATPAQGSGHQRRAGTCPGMSGRSHLRAPRG